MVAFKELSFAGLVWLSLASRGLALGIDENTNDLTLLARYDVEELYDRDFNDELYGRDVDDELYERDVDDELYERYVDDIGLDTREYLELYERTRDSVRNSFEPSTAPTHYSYRGGYKGKRGLGMGDLVFGKEKTYNLKPWPSTQAQIDREKAAKGRAKAKAENDQRAKLLSDQLKKRPVKPAAKAKSTRGLGMGDLIFGKEKTYNLKPWPSAPTQKDRENAAKAARVQFAKDQLKKPTPPARKPKWQG